MKEGHRNFILPTISRYPKTLTCLIKISEAGEQKHTRHLGMEKLSKILSPPHLTP